MRLAVITLHGVARQENGRGERIRTSDSYVPNVVLYQAELRPDLFFFHRSRLIAKEQNSNKDWRYWESAIPIRA